MTAPQGTINSGKKREQLDTRAKCWEERRDDPGPGYQAMKFSRICSITAVAAVATVTTILWLNREPRYQGITLSEWITQADTAYEMSRGQAIEDPKWQASSQAVQAIGTRAVPWLVKWASDGDARTTNSMLAWLDQHALFRSQVRNTARSDVKAVVGLRLLGEQSKCTWPAFNKWTYSKSPARRLLGLVYLTSANADKATLKPVLTRLLNDPDPQVKMRAAYQFHFYFPQDAAAAGVYRLFPAFQGMQTIQSRPADWQWQEIMQQ